jgi:sigma-B regulation protein RsbU (phosphoserine phosphatase)
MQQKLTLHNDITEVPTLGEFVEQVAEQLGYNMTDSMNMNLALEEAVVNVMNYAYPEGTIGDILIEAATTETQLVFTIKDSGTPFDPTQVEDPDTTLSIEDRPIGGLGIFLVKQLMDSVTYNYTDGFNILTLKKKLP